MASHAHPTITLNQIPSVTAAVLGRNGPPKNPSRTAIPESSERPARLQTRSPTEASTKMLRRLNGTGEERRRYARRLSDGEAK